MVQLFPLDNQLLTLAEEVKPGATKFRTLGRFAKTSIAEDDDSRYLVGKQYIGMSPFQDNAEVAYIDVTTQPDLVAGTTNTYEYTFVARGIHSDNTATPPTLTNVSEEKTHVGQRSSVGIIVGGGIFAGISEQLLASIGESLNKYVQFQLFAGSQDVTVGDGRAYFKVPSGYDGHNLSAITASVVTAGTTGTTDIQIHNVTDAVDMLSTKLTIDSGETDSENAATPVVIDTANDDISAGDIIRVDIDATSTTQAQGLVLNLTFNNPV